MTDAALLEERPMTYLPVTHADPAAHVAAADEEQRDGFTVSTAEPIATVGWYEVRPLAAPEMPA